MKPALIATAAAALPCVAWGQLSIPWWTVDAGGGAFTGDGFTLSGTAAQVDAGPAMIGGGYTVTGGFWVVATRPACAADVGAQGGVEGSDGVLDNNDFVVFISLFFGHDPRADVGAQGGVPGSDGAWDNNDFVVFIDLFFAGCP
ncbi:MAG TPA: GC-type dockerin domain-anchored protein [Phycisphaerales bacterium]|nr:GC-type dockerin domain-anchored protein [Phycisphaerales bacterium]